MAQANAVFAIVRQIFSSYAVIADDYASPIVPKMRRGLVKADVHQPKRWLNDDEIRSVWTACGEDDLGMFGPLVRILILCGQRREKVATMKWADLDLEKGTWHIRREPREKGTPGTLTLPQMALDIIEALPRRANSDFVFWSRTGGPFNAWSQRKAELDAKLPKDTPPWVLHDCRRTFRKLCTRAQVPTEIAERAIGHALTGIQATYDDPKEYEPMIDEALAKVAIEVGKIIEPEHKVVAFPSQRGRS